MGGSELFILFPKGKDVKDQPFYVNEEPRVYEDKLSNITNEIEDVEKFLAAENFQLFYDLENVNAFLSPIDVGEDSYPDLFFYFITVLQTWGDNWREEAQQNEHTQYTYYHAPIKDDTLCEMTERINNQDEEISFLLVNCEAIKCKDNTIDTARDGVNTTIDVRNLEVKPIAKWFESHRHPQRKFSLNQKHGKNGRGGYSSSRGNMVSKLMCSEQEAERLLRKAIGNGDEKKTLYFYDVQAKKYIEFKHEGKNVYHGYHLLKKNENRIPNNIKKLIIELIDL